jgi:4-amino-4-deoxy-L-arabinose transferase-like glycosyltransferase
MTEEQRSCIMVDPPEMTDSARPALRTGWRSRQNLPLAGILLVAAGLRLLSLDGSSLWYDEIVTMQVARTDGTAALVERLDQIDGTRAPLHPLILQAWLRVFGSSDLAGRSFSALCGLGTVFVIFVLGLRAFDETTGLWAAWLAAVCPPLIYYSQEARMYAWLVLLSCLSWLVFLSFRHAAKPGQCLVYWLLLTALFYSHPLGVFMIAAHGLAFLLVRRHLRLPILWWLMVQCAVLVSFKPWLPRYTDHGTDYPMPRYSIRFLLAVPIEYVGGNGVVFACCLALIALGMVSRKLPGRLPWQGIRCPAENLILLTWAAAPPCLMYVYSQFFQPIFGPPRYHLYSAPAYLILLAHGLAQLPRTVRWPLAALGLVLSILLLQHYQPGQKADWRSLAAWLETQEKESRTGDSPREVPTIEVHPSDPRFPREQVEAARYYLSPHFQVIPAGSRPWAQNSKPPQSFCEVFCRPDVRKSIVDDPELQSFYGLIVVRRKTADR